MHHARGNQRTWIAHFDNDSLLPPHYKLGFPFDSPIPTRHLHRTAFLGKALARFWPTVFPGLPEGIGLASRGHATPRDTVFPIDSAHTSAPPLSSPKSAALRGPAHPAGNGSGVISAACW